MYIEDERDEKKNNVRIGFVLVFNFVVVETDEDNGQNKKDKIKWEKDLF